MSYPIIFVPGTGGTSLDIELATDQNGNPSPFKYQFPSDAHTFASWPVNQLTHDAKEFDYNPGYLDPDGPRVWIGPEAIEALLKDTVPTNLGNHYLDALKFDTSGYNTRTPQAVQGSVVQYVNLANLGRSTIANLPFYDSLIEFITNNDVQLVDTPVGQVVRKSMYGSLIDFLSNGLGRPLCTDLSCDDPQNNGVYLFTYDWRADLPDQVTSLNMFVQNVLEKTQVPKVVLITHSLGGLVTRAYYLTDPLAAGNIDRVISLSGGFGGIIQGLKFLVMGETWGLGLNVGSVSVGLAEWMTHDLGQNWPTAYCQLPSSEDWFFDDGKQVPSSPSQSYDRSYIRDDGFSVQHHYQNSMDWIRDKHNSAITIRAENYFANLGNQGTALGDFTEGTGAIKHYRIVSRGRMNTVVAMHLSTGTSDAGNYSIETGAAADPGAYAPVVSTDPVLGDGDGTVPYHGLLGHLANDEQQVYVLVGTDPVDNKDYTEHFAITESPSVHALIKSLLSDPPPPHSAPFLLPSDTNAQETV